MELVVAMEKIALKDEEINKLRRLLKQCQICEEKKGERLKYAENVIVYLEGKLQLL